MVAVFRVTAAWLIAGIAWSQTPPEEPDWGKSSASTTSQPSEDTTTSDTLQPTDPNATDLTTSVQAQPATQDEAIPPATLKAMDRSGPAEADEEAEVGVPDANNFNLPKLSDYGQPFFERQGLRFRVGPAHLNISLSIAQEYNDNIYASHTNTVADMVTRVSPYFELGMGDYRDKNENYLLLDYRPSYDYYPGQTNANRLNQNLDFATHVALSRYVTTATLGYINSNLPTATQTDLQNYQIFNFNWDNSYYVTAKTFGRLTLTALNQQYQNSQNYTTVSASPLIGYEYSPKTTIFVGPYAGIAYIGQYGSSSNTQNSPSNSSTQTFQGVSLGLNYTNLRKFKFNGVVGIQSRQFHGENATGATNFTTPVFDFTFSYTPREKTDFGLELIRNVQISDILQGSTYTDSQLQFNVTHRLTPHITLSVGIGYQYLQYQGLAPEGSINQYAVVTPTVGYSFWRDQCTLNVYYQRQQRDSNVEAAAYSINTYGLQLIFQF